MVDLIALYIIQLMAVNAFFIASNYIGDEDGMSIRTFLLNLIPAYWVILLIRVIVTSIRNSSWD